MSDLIKLSELYVMDNEWNRWQTLLTIPGDVTLRVDRTVISAIPCENTTHTNQMKYTAFDCYLHFNSIVHVSIHHAIIYNQECTYSIVDQHDNRIIQATIIPFKITPITQLSYKVEFKVVRIMEEFMDEVRHMQT